METPIEKKPAKRAPKRELVRKTFPKIRIVERKSGLFFQVDARKEGTNGKQEHYPTKDEAITRARTIAGELFDEGAEGLKMPAELRMMAFAGAKLLEPFGKTILQACEFYRAHLLGEKAKEDSATINTLADAWHESKKREGWRDKTMRDISSTVDLLKKLWGTTRILEITQNDIETYLERPRARY